MISGMGTKSVMILHLGEVVAKTTVKPKAKVVPKTKIKSKTKTKSTRRGSNKGLKEFLRVTNTKIIVGNL